MNPKQDKTGSAETASPQSITNQLILSTIQLYNKAQKEFSISLYILVIMTM